MKQGKLVEIQYFEYGLECSNREMYTKERIIYEATESIFEKYQKENDFQDFWQGHFMRKCDFEGDIEEIVFYYDREDEIHREVLKSICKSLNLIFDSFIDCQIRFTIY